MYKVTITTTRYFMSRFVMGLAIWGLATFVPVVADAESASPGNKCAKPSPEEGGYRYADEDFEFCAPKTLRKEAFITADKPQYGEFRDALQQKIIPQLRKDPKVPQEAKDKLISHLINVLANFDGRCDTARYLGTRQLEATRGTTKENDLDDLGEKDNDDDPTPDPAIKEMCAWTVMHLQNRLCVPSKSSQQWRDHEVYQVAAYVQLLHQILSTQSDQCINKTAKDLRRYNRQWQVVALEGYTQYPWEYGLNSLIRGYRLKEDSVKRWSPSRGQLIFLHPSIGLGLNSMSKIEDNDPDLRTVFLLAAELVGGLRYFNEYKNYLGGSIVFTANNADLTKPSIGGAIHLFKYFSLGYSWGVYPKTYRGQGTAFMLFDVGSLWSTGHKIESSAPKILNRFK